MARSYSYALVRLDGHPARDERLNVGMIVFDGERADVRSSRNMSKLSAISGALDVDAVRTALASLPEVDDYARSAVGSEPSQRVTALGDFSPFSFSDLLTFTAHSPVDYEASIQTIVQRLVDPEPAPVKPKAHRPSPLATLIKKSLRKDRILARKGEDISAHRVVTGLPLAEGLHADFVLKNGAMHVIETVDASRDETSLRRVITDIAISALVIEQARIVFGEKETKPQLVYFASASLEAAAMPSLYAAAHQGTELINWASRDDQAMFLARLNSLAVPFESHRKGLSVHASTQPKLALN